MLVTNKLHFNVARPREVALYVNFIATKEVACLALCGVHGVLYFGCRLHDFHSASTATEGCLNCNWPTEVVSEISDLFCTRHEFRCAGNNGRSTAQCCFAARDLVAHFVNGFWWWTDECNTHRRNCASEVCVLAEESVSGVNTVCTAVSDGLQDGLSVEVALGCGLATKCVCLVGETHMQCISIEL